MTLLPGYALWCAAVAAGAFLCTWVSLAGWERWIRREEAEALRQLKLREAEDRARIRTERASAAALAASERRHRALTRAGAIAVWQATQDGRITALEGWAAFTGSDPQGAMGSTNAWLMAVAPEDRGRASLSWRRAIADGKPLDVEFRVLRADRSARWCRARAVRLVPEGAALEQGEWIGVIEDIDSRRRAEEARLLLVREVNHRAKNMLAVVQAVVRLTRAATPEAFVAAVSARIAALSRAHDLLSQQAWGDVALEDLLRGELAAYIGPRDAAGEEAPRVRIAGPPLRLRPEAVQPLAIAVHELAVNAAKYGALSPDGAGFVEISWTLPAPSDGAATLVWQEQGGPAVAAPPARRGFGTRVVDASVQDQLRGRVEREWLPGGLCCRLSIPIDRLHQEEEEDTAPAAERPSWPPGLPLPGQA
jgi:PAS domain S-box-containing protein